MTINDIASESEMGFWLTQAIQFVGIFLAAFLAYALGIHQQGVIDKARKVELAEREATEQFFLLRNAYNEVWAHIASLTLLKQDFVHELIQDAEKMAKANPGNLREVFSQCPTFLKKFEEAAYDVSDALSRIEFVAVKNEHFYEAKFMVRTALKSVNDFIKERHSLIDATPKDGNANLLVVLNYFIPMLLDYSKGIAERTDLSLTMLLCIKSQIEIYAETEFQERDFKVKRVPEIVRKQLPSIEYMKGFGDKLGVDFSGLAIGDQQEPPKAAAPSH